MANSSTVYLFDASIYIFRAWFGYPESIFDQKGRSVNAVFGYWRQLLQGMVRHRPQLMLVAFDESLFSGFRHQLYPDYKANRALPDEALAYQLMLCRILTEAVGLTTRSSAVYEADDVLYSAAQVAHAATLNVNVVTRDKDLAQIIRADDVWSDWAADTSMDYSQLCTHWGVDTCSIPDVLALAGDAVDNIPGIPGVGLKTANQLMKHFGGLECLYRDIDQVGTLAIRGASGLRDRLLDFEEQAFLFRELIRLHLADCAITVNDFAVSNPDGRQVTALLDELGLGVGFKREWERYCS